MSFFESATYSFPTGDNNINNWADHCEFFCLVSEDKSTTVEKLKDRLLDQHQYNYENASKALRLMNTTTGKHILSGMEAEEDEYDYEQEQTDEFDAIDEALEESDFPDVTPKQQSNESLLDDKITNEFLFLFRFLESRENLFGASYPFTLDLKNNRISVKELPLSSRSKIYLSLLLSSVLRIFSPANRNRLGHLFEKLSIYPFKKMISAEARIEFFGAGGEADEEAFFSGTFAEKINKLSQIIKSDTTTIFKENIHDHNHSGDGGLDLVGWVPFDDNNSKMPLFFGQCACGNDWIDKEWDAHFDKFSNVLQLNDFYLLFHFIGKSFRQQDGSWYRPGDILKVILVDRLRILTSLKEDEYEHVAALYDNLINEAIEIKLAEIDIAN